MCVYCIGHWRFNLVGECLGLLLLKTRNPILDLKLFADGRHRRAGARERLRVRVRSAAVASAEDFPIPIPKCLNIAENAPTLNF